MSVNYTSKLVSGKIVEEEVSIKGIGEKAELSNEQLIITTISEGFDFKTLKDKIGIMPEELLINVVGDEVVQQ